MKIFQIYYDPAQIPLLDPGFTAYDNTSNLRPELCEWYVWDKEHENIVAQELDHWGFVSWRYKEKMFLTGKQTTDYITANPGYDVYLFNPFLVNEALFANPWEQGDIYHPNLSQIADSFMAKSGYKDINVRELVIDRRHTVFATYVVGNREFWDGYMAFSRRIFTEAASDAEFHKQVFAPGSALYAHDKSLPMFTFLNERLISTYLELSGLSVLAYHHTDETMPAKYKPYIADIGALSDLKVLINDYDSEELYNIWDHYRLDLLKRMPGILNLW